MKVIRHSWQSTQKLRQLRSSETLLTRITAGCTIVHHNSNRRKEPVTAHNTQERLNQRSYKIPQ
jgi:hypothetical protein